MTTGVDKVAMTRHDMPRYHGKPRIYIIASQPRSGSHYLAYLLRETRKAGVPLEYFHPRHWQDWMKRCRTENPQYAFKLLCQLRSTSNGWFGVKAHWHQFAHAISMDLDRELAGATYIYLSRNDILDQAISHAIALQTGVWIGGQKPVAPPVFSVDRITESIRFMLNEREQWERFFAYTGNTPHRIYYEDLVANVNSDMTGVCKVLGIEWTLPTSINRPPAIQRTGLNAEWRTRFHQVLGGRYDDFWKREFLGTAKVA